MTDHIQINIDLPPSVAVAAAWAKRAQEASEKAEAFYKFAVYFFNRAGHDCRLRVQGVLQDGNFYDGPLRGYLTYGTEEEWQKGFLSSNNREDFEDGWRQPFSSSTLLDIFMVPSDNYTLEGHLLETDPAEIAYQALVKTFGIGGCTRAFLVNDHMGPEAVAFFFPLTEWGDGDEYIICCKNTRYNTESYFLFEGDPEDYAKVRRRGARWLGEELKPFCEIPLPSDYPSMKGTRSCMTAFLRSGWLYTGDQDVKTLRS